MNSHCIAICEDSCSQRLRPSCKLNSCSYILSAFLTRGPLFRSCFIEGFQLRFFSKYLCLNLFIGRSRENLENIIFHSDLVLSTFLLLALPLLHLSSSYILKRVEAFCLRLLSSEVPTPRNLCSAKQGNGTGELALFPLASCFCYHSKWLRFVTSILVCCLRPLLGPYTWQVSSLQFSWAPNKTKSFTFSPPLSLFLYISSTLPFLLLHRSVFNTKVKYLGNELTFV